MNKLMISCFVILAALAACNKPAAKVFFVSPKEGAVISGPAKDGKVPVKVQMGVEGMVVEPAGEVHAGKGHHHILINRDTVEQGGIIPPSDNKQVIHYGKGQTEAELNLEPGSYTLTLQFADGSHASYGPNLSSTIHIKVEAASK
ncbi:MAG: DUF4399 domain-containing protein [Spirochaetia bacterium]|nr:DUF4399 domain-containing protein [Spirochaetia bacterium]